MRTMRFLLLFKKQGVGVRSKREKIHKLLVRNHAKWTPCSVFIGEFSFSFLFFSFFYLLGVDDHICFPVLLPEGICWKGFLSAKKVKKKEKKREKKEKREKRKRRERGEWRGERREERKRDNWLYFLNASLYLCSSLPFLFPSVVFHELLYLNS